MTLNRLLTLLTAVLALLVCGMLALFARGAWMDYSGAGAGLQALRLTQLAMVAAEKLSYERGPVNAVLGDRQPADPARQARLRQARAATDLALLQLERALREAPPRAIEMAALQQALAAARRNVDQLAALAPAARTPDRLAGALDQMFRLVPLALDAVTSSTLAAGQAYPHIAGVLTRARYAVELREYAGRLGSVLTVALVTRQPLSADDLQQLHQTRGRIEQLRQQVQLPVAPDADGSRYARALARVDDSYFGAGLQLVDHMEKLSGERRDYGLDTGQFAQRYVPTMAPILALRDELLQEAEAHARQDFSDTGRELVLVLAAGGAVLLALTLLLMLVRQRLVLPLLRATRAAVRLGNGDYSRDPGGATRNDEIGAMLRALSTLRANSIERQRLEQERQRLIDELKLRADTDYLTGILNRRAFAAAGNVRLRGARERDAALGVILFDIDHFKAVNDTHGHDAGDQVLVRVAELVRGVLRDGEILARHGGEEFVVMPAWCGMDAACALAERLRAAIEAEPLTLNDGHILRVTASFGVAAAPAAHAALDDLLHAADLALYRAKRKGRNRVERAG